MHGRRNTRRESLSLGPCGGSSLARTQGRKYRTSTSEGERPLAKGESRPQSGKTSRCASSNRSLEEVSWNLALLSKSREGSNPGMAEIRYKENQGQATR